MASVKELPAVSAFSRERGLKQRSAGTKQQSVFKTPAPLKLSHELRTSDGGSLAARRAIVALSLVAIGAMGAVSLYQMGVIRHLPEPPLPKLDADRVDSSDEAYKRLSMPDAVMGVGSYAATMALAEMGGRDRAHTHPWIPLAMAGKVAFDVAQSVRMIATQSNKFGAFCFYCLISAVATFGTALLAVKEARKAGREFMRRVRSG